MVDLAPGDAGGDAAIDGELLETTHGGTGERVVQRLAVPSPIALAGGRLGLPAEVVAFPIVVEQCTIDRLEMGCLSAVLI